MHIVYVTRELPPSPRCGGIGSYVWDVARQVVKYGHKVTIISASDDTRKFQESLIDGVLIIRLSGGDFAISGVEKAGSSKLIKYARTITRYHSYRSQVADTIDSLITKDNVDLIEVAEYGAEALKWMKRSRRVPMVVRLHTPTALNRNTVKRISVFNLIKYWQAMQEYRLLKSSDAITSCSHALADWVIGDSGIEERSIVTITNPVFFTEWLSKKKNKQVHSGIEVFYAGTVVEAKGVGDLIQSVRRLRNAHIDIRLIIAGRLGDFGEKLVDQQKKDIELQGWLQIIGPVSRDKLKEYYSSVNVVCFPSWWEGLGIVCLEAMACGALVIGSSAGGMSEIIDNGKDGFLVSPKDPVLLADCILRVINLPQAKREEIAAAAQAKVKSEFDVDIIIPKLLGFYGKTITDFQSSKSESC